MKFSLTILILSTLFLVTPMNDAQAQTETIYDETKVPQYSLPDPLSLLDGGKVTDVEAWQTKRRAEVLNLFAEHVYGKTPEKALKFEFELTETGEAFGGKAIRKQVTLYPFGRDVVCAIPVLIYLPKKSDGPVPTFVGLNFRGNHATSLDPAIEISPIWTEMMKRDKRYVDMKPEETRGVAASRWAFEMIVDRGYACATIFYGDIDPDYDDGFQNGIHPLFYKDGQSKPEADQWGSIGAWSWGLSRALDYFGLDKDIDQTKVAIFGHSRLGKTSLWGGAQDERFAMVISNDSGCGGAALSKRCFGETVGRINRSFPHWFNDNFNQYNEKEAKLPLDQHMLIALIAPRPVYVASAEDDRWADPHGEFLSAKHAGSVYKLFGLTGVGVDTMPAVNQPVGDYVGYHIRTGKHDVTDYDWTQYMNFADRHLK